MKNTLVLLVVSFASCFVGCSKKFTEEEAREKFENERIFAVEKENADLRSQLVASQAREVSNQKEVLELKLKTARQETEISSRNALLTLWERKTSNLETREAGVAKNLGILATKEDQIKKDKAEIEKWNKDVEEAKIAYKNFVKEAEKNLIELQIMDVNLRQAQEVFAVMKASPNTPANRQRMSDHVAYITKLQREYHIALEEAKHKLTGDLTSAKLMIP